MRIYIQLLFILIVILYTAFIKLSVFVPIRTLVTVFAFLLLFLLYNRLIIDTLKTHALTVLVFAAITVIGAFLTIINGRGPDVVVGFALSNIVQPFLIIFCTYALLRLTSIKFVVWVFLGSAIATGAVALLQFVDIEAAWRVRELLGDIQGSPAEIEAQVEGQGRPMGLSLTPVIFSYHIASAYIIANLLHRRQMMSGRVYGFLVMAMLAMAAANGTRSLLLGIFVHEFLFNFVKLRFRSLAWLGALVVLAVVGLLYLEAADSRVASLNDASAEGRLVLYTFGLNLAFDNPFGLGWGFEPSDFAWLYWDELSGFVNADGVFRLGIHNAFLNFFLTYGLYGALIIAFAAYIKPQKFIIIGLTFTAYFVNAMFHNNGLFLGEYYFWFAFAIFLYLYAEQPASARSRFSFMPAWRLALVGLSPAMGRGQRPAIPDAALLAAIQADRKAFTLQGGDYRDVWARLRVGRGIRVSPRQVLRVMRENELLAPPRSGGGEDPRQVEIVTDAPSRMWSTGAMRVFTAEEGWGWIFTVVEHGHGACVGWQVSKRGDRFAALRPVSMAIARLRGWTAAGAARGLVLRIGHGFQYQSDDFINQITYWGIEPSYVFAEQARTDGVSEAFNRALRERVVHGRSHRDIEELHDAVDRFVETYNAGKLPQPNAGPTPPIDDGPRP